MGGGAEGGQGWVGAVWDHFEDEDAIGIIEQVCHALGEEMHNGRAQRGDCM